MIETTLFAVPRIEADTVSLSINPTDRWGFRPFLYLPEAERMSQVTAVKGLAI